MRYLGKLQFLFINLITKEVKQKQKQQQQRAIWYIIVELSVTYSDDFVLERNDLWTIEKRLKR